MITLQDGTTHLAKCPITESERKVSDAIHFISEANRLQIISMIIGLIPGLCYFFVKSGIFNNINNK